MDTEKSELKWNQVQDALGSLPLTWASIGYYVIIMNKKPDMMIGGEPYLALQLWYDRRCGKIISRVWGETISSSRVASVAEFISACLTHFKGRPCLGYPLSDKQESEQDFLISYTPIPRKTSRACVKLMSPGTANAVTSCPECLKLEPIELKDEMADIEAFIEDGCVSNAISGLDTCINEAIFKGYGGEAHKHETVKVEDTYSFSSPVTASSDIKQKYFPKAEEINKQDGKPI